MSDAWAYALVVSVLGGVIGVFLKVLYDSIKKDKAIALLEYEKEKSDVKQDHANDSIDDVTVRLKSEHGWRDGDN